MADAYRLDLNFDNYCVIGNPVAHSKSPLIHQAFAEQTRQNIRYQAILVDVGGFTSFLHSFRQQGGKGLNVTLPFKEEAFHAMQVTTELARKAGSVNTVWFTRDGSCCGDTTDGRGLVIDMLNQGIELRHKRLLVLGAGGAVRGVLPDLLAAVPASITVANRTHARAEQLALDFAAYPEVKALPMAGLAGRQFEIVINGTSASLRREMLPLPADLLASGAACYDMVYADTDTVFISWAKQHGAVIAVDGLGMLVEQAAESFSIWRGVRPETRPVIEMLRR